MKDAEWIADLLQHGLLKASFIPKPQQQEVRDLTRTRTTLIQERSRLVNRIHKVLEDANLKLGSVVSDITGMTGSAILNALIHGQEDPERLADLAHGSLRKKREQLIAALQGQRKRASSGFAARTAHPGRLAGSFDCPTGSRDRGALAPF